jgi:hypothetical protein
MIRPSLGGTGRVSKKLDVRVYVEGTQKLL